MTWAGWRGPPKVGHPPLAKLPSVLDRELDLCFAYQRDGTYKLKSHFLIESHRHHIHSSQSLSAIWRSVHLSLPHLFRSLPLQLLKTQESTSGKRWKREEQATSRKNRRRPLPRNQHLISCQQDLGYLQERPHFSPRLSFWHCTMP